MSKKYEILEAVGHGGMAKVYRARDLDLQRDVAIKELSEELTENERFVHLFLSEGRKMASISHPNVLPIHSIDDDGQQRPRLVMELAQSSLADQMGTDALEPVLVERIGRQVLQGLEAIHGAGLVHRDIKPANIFFSHDLYKIGDFGIATDNEEHTQLLATPKYMAPEVLTRPHLVGPASDLYSLGLILYEALVGGARFEEEVARVVDTETATAVPPPPPGARKHIWRTFHGSAGELPAPHRLNSEIPEALSRWVSKLTRKEISERFQTCREALITLDRGSDVGVQTTYGADVTQPVGPPKKKRFGPLQIVLLAAVVLMAFVGGLITWRIYTRPTVEISSEPEGAAILFEGEEVGRTTVSLPMRVGVSVELRLKGFESEVLTLKDRKTPILSASLQWKPVDLRSEPAGARVLVAGEERGRTPYALIGEGERMQVALELEGYETAILEVEPGSSPPTVILEPRMPELPGAEAVAGPEQLAAALRGFLSPDTESRWALDGDGGSRVRFGELIGFRAEVPEAVHAAVFLILSTGDGVLLYPSRGGGGLQLEAKSGTVLPLREHARVGYRIEASDPAGRDFAFLLTSPEPLPEPPAGEPLGRWMAYFAFTAGEESSPVLALARWAAGVRRQAPEAAEMVMTEILVEAGP